MLGTHDKRVRELEGLIHESAKLMQIQPEKIMIRTQQARAPGRASCPRHLCDQPRYQPSGNEAQCENAEVIESSGNRQAAVGGQSQCLLDGGRLPKGFGRISKGGYRKPPAAKAVILRFCLSKVRTGSPVTVGNKRAAF